MPERRPIVVVGSINIDLVASAARIPIEGETVTGSGFQIHPGGKGANQAVAVARLGYPVRLIGRLGDDTFGAQLLDHLKGVGVDVGGVMTTPGSSGVAVIVVAESGENCIVVVPGANALLTPNDLDANAETLRSAGIVLAQLEVPTETVMHLAEICADAGVPLLLDPAPARTLPAELLAKVGWFTPNETEAEFFMADGVDWHDTSTVAKQLLDRGVAGVVLKRGADGVWVQMAGERGERVSSYKVKAVDTTAAGDAFNGAFATGLMLRKGPIEAARFAAAAAAVSVTRAGAQPSMATMDEVNALMEASGTVAGADRFSQFAGVSRRCNALAAGGSRRRAGCAILACWRRSAHLGTRARAAGFIEALQLKETPGSYLWVLRDGFILVGLRRVKRLQATQLRRKYDSCAPSHLFRS